jgi:hypothetical protein
MDSSESTGVKVRHLTMHFPSTHVQGPLSGTPLPHGQTILSGVTTSPPVTPMVTPRLQNSLKY